jgi:hypothetical protein
MRAWHFTSGWELRDGKPLEIGKTYRHDGALIICESGLHASVKLFDAMQYAPGSVLSLVECGGEIIKESDKLCCRERTVLHAEDIDKTLHLAACDIAEAALLIAEFYDKRCWLAIEAKRAWVRGDISGDILDASCAASWAASLSAISAASRAAIRAASRAASWSESWAESRAAIGAAIRAASCAASWAESWAASLAAISAASRAASCAASIDEINLSLTDFVLERHPKFAEFTK